MPRSPKHRESAIDNPLLCFMKRKLIKASSLHLRKVERSTNIVMTGKIDVKTDPAKTGENTLSARNDPKSFPCTKKRYHEGTSLNYDKDKKKVFIGTKHADEAIRLLQIERLATYACNPDKYSHYPPVIDSIEFNNAVVACNVGHSINRVKMQSVLKGSVFFEPTVFAGLNYRIPSSKARKMEQKYLRENPEVGILFPFDRLVFLVFRSGKYNILGKHHHTHLPYLTNHFKKVAKPFEGSEVLPAKGKKIAESTRDAIKAARNTDPTIHRIDDTANILRGNAANNQLLIPLGMPPPAPVLATPRIPATPLKQAKPVQESPEPIDEDMRSWLDQMQYGYQADAWAEFLRTRT